MAQAPVAATAPPLEHRPEVPGLMDIGAAIRELCQVHTLNDPETGFTVYQPLQRTDAYHEAWATLRRAVDLPTEPAEAAAPRLDLKPSPYEVDPETEMLVRRQFEEIGR